ncbi:unnamed protein product [Adineta steineri]|uniref:Kinesin light chain n=1 Tax=Adineta steineri TaxID=433720 RepID=A0A819JF46_9BILA|nr:unnamed protein product [Adineta steineri]
MGNLEKALSSHQKALEIQKRILPSNHRDLAVTYDNIGSVYGKLEKHAIALFFHQKALEINEKVLPSNHPDLAINYNNIALIYKSMENYLEAISFLQKARQIQEIILPSDSSDLATTYDNIGGIYQDMDQYENAAFFYEKALEINEKVLHSNHPELSITYGNIGNAEISWNVYRDLNELAFLYRKNHIKLRYQFSKLNDKSDQQHPHSFEVVNNHYVDDNGVLIHDRIPRLRNFFKQRINSYTNKIDVVKAQQLGQQYQYNKNYYNSPY